MKKIFTLLFVAAMAVPALMAENVTLKLYGQTGTDMNTYGPDFNGGVLGTLDCEIVLNEDGSYTFPKFLGVEKAKLDFYMDKSVTPSMPDESVRYGFVVKFAEVPEAPAYSYENDALGELNYESIDDIPTLDDYTSTIVAANSFGTQFNYRIVNIADDFTNDYTGKREINVNTDDERRKTAIFTGEDGDYILLSPYYWCLNSEKDNSTMSAIVKRSYFSENNGKYTVTLQGACASYFEKIGEAWPEMSTGSELKHYLVFDLPVNAGIDGVVADDDVDNAPVEYFNLQGVRVENPAAGLYIKRQGSKVEKVAIR